jgi:hypothetical protein
MLTRYFLQLQPRPPQIHRQSPDRDQRQPTISTAVVLQEEEVPAVGSTTETDEGHQEEVEQEGGGVGDGEAEEEADAFSDEEVCCQGGGIGRGLFGRDEV